MSGESADLQLSIGGLLDVAGHSLAAPHQNRNDDISDAHTECVLFGRPAFVHRI